MMNEPQASGGEHGLPGWVQRSGGIVIVDKPAGPTSFSIVNHIRKLCGGIKTGHTGTLDPLATGVLPLVFGPATKLSDVFMSADKIYRASFRLGLETDTQDIEGQIIAQRDVPDSLTVERLESLLPEFTGEIEQLPPMYSARKINGQRLYKLARQGQEVARSPRKITIHQLKLTRCAADEFEIWVHCSPGTYIRSLGADLAAAAGSCAAMSALVREASGAFTLADALPLPHIAELAAAGRWAEFIWPIERAVAHLPELEIDRAGQPLPIDLSAMPVTGQTPCIRLTAVDGTLHSIIQLAFDTSEARAYTALPRGLRAARVLWKNDRATAR